MTDEPRLSRAQLRQQRLDALRAKSEADGTTAEMFPTAEPKYSLTVGEAMRASQVEAALPVEPVPEGPLARQAHEINTRFMLADRNEQTATGHRLAAAILLAGAKGECERLKINFKSWVAGNIPQHYDYLRKMAAIGASENPAQALEDWRDDNARRNRARRAQKAQQQIEGTRDPFAPAADQFGPPAPELLGGAEDVSSDQGMPEPGAAEGASAPDYPTPGLEPTIEEHVEPPATTGESPDQVLMVAIELLPVADVDMRRKVADAAAGLLPTAEVKAHIKAVGASVGLEIARAKGWKFQPTTETLRADYQALSIAERADFLRWAVEEIDAEAPANAEQAGE